jgi:hypothetical protein
MLLNAAAVVAIVGVADFLGVHDLDLDLCSFVVGISVLSGILLLVVEACISRRKGNTAILVETVYVCAFVGLDPIWSVGKAPPLARIIPILLLAPVAWGGASFVPRGYRIAGIGACLVLFGTVLGLAYNIREGGYARVGLLGLSWVRV